jgi:lysozyme
VRFAFIKATEGGDRRDPEFGRNWAGARRAGIARGAYHFFTFCRAGLAQAQNFVASWGGSPGELAPAVDVELGGNCAEPPESSKIEEELQAFLAEVERVTGRRPTLYFTREADERILRARFEAYPRWPRNIFREPRPSSWQFWQFANNGRLSGVTTPVDLDVFSGTLDELERARDR